MSLPELVALGNKVERSHEGKKRKVSNPDSINTNKRILIKAP